MNVRIERLLVNSDTQWTDIPVDFELELTDGQRELIDMFVDVARGRGIGNPVRDSETGAVRTPRLVCSMQFEVSPVAPAGGAQ